MIKITTIIIQIIKKQLGFRNPQEKLEKMVSDLESPNLAIFKDSTNFPPSQSLKIS